MKRFLVILLSLCLALGIFAACGGSEVKITLEGGAVFSGSTDTERSVKKGEEVTIEFPATNGKEFLGWEEDGINIGTANPLTYVAEGDTTIKALTRDVDRNFENVVFENINVAYTGAAIVPQAIVPGSDQIFGFEVTYAITKDGASVSEIKDTGVYKVVATITGQGYNTLTKEATITVSKNEMGVSMLPKTVQYDGTAKTLVVNNAPAGANIVYEYKKNGTVVTEAINAGEYNVKATVTCANFEDVVTESILKITQAPSVITAVNEVIVYEDGISVNSLANATINNSEQTLKYAFKFGGEAVEAATEIGTYEVTVTADASANYKAPTPVIVYVTISDNRTMDGVSFDNKNTVYNGAEQTIEITGELPSGYIVAYKNNYGTNVGTYNAQAIITEIATGTKTTLSADMVIAPKEITIAVDEYEKIQGADNPDIVGDVTTQIRGLLEGDDTIADLGGKLLIEHEVTKTTPIPAEGSEFEAGYPVTISGFNTNNYDITYVNGLIKIVMPTFTETETANVSEKIRPVDGQPLGLQYDVDTNTTTLNGEEWYGMGVNYFSLLQSAVANNYDTSIVLEKLDMLANEYNVKAIRFSVMPFYWTGYNSYFNFYGKYIECFDKIVNKCEEVGIGLIPSFFWTTAIQDYYDEGTIAGLLNADSQTRKFMTEFTTMIVNRYENSPAIFMWEYGNEYNLSSDHGGYATTELPSNSSRPGRTEAEDELKASRLNQVWTWWTTLIHEEDAHHRLIGSGDSMPRDAQYNLSANGNWTKDTLAQHKQIVETLNPAYMNAMSWHVYGPVTAMDEGNRDVAGQRAFAADGEIPQSEIYTWEEYMNHMKNVLGAELGKSAYFGECGLGNPSNETIGLPGDKYNYDQLADTCLAMGEAQLKTKFPLTLYWNYDHTSNLLPDRTDERSTGTEWSWHEGTEKGEKILNTIKTINDQIDAARAAAKA